MPFSSRISVTTEPSLLEALILVFVGLFELLVPVKKSTTPPIKPLAPPSRLPAAPPKPSNADEIIPGRFSPSQSPTFGSAVFKNQSPKGLIIFSLAKSHTGSRISFLIHGNAVSLNHGITVPSIHGHTCSVHSGLITFFHSFCKIPDLRSIPPRSRADNQPIPFLAPDLAARPTSRALVTAFEAASWATHSFSCIFSLRVNLFIISLVLLSEVSYSTEPSVSWTTLAGPYSVCTTEELSPCLSTSPPIAPPILDAAPLTAPPNADITLPRSPAVCDWSPSWACSPPPNRFLMIFPPRPRAPLSSLPPKPNIVPRKLLSGSGWGWIPVSTSSSGTSSE